MKRSPQFIIFTTVLLDLVGFGIVIPLIGLYGKNLGATPFELAILGSVYSLMQFMFAPFWGALSDRFGRRPIILISLFGSSVSYLIFGLAASLWTLIIARALAGIFAANISAAQAYIADVTPPEKRAQGMGLIGAAFGVGFTFGPPLGGAAAHYLGLAAPGLIAAGLTFVNFIFAVGRLTESLPPEKRLSPKAFSWSPIDSRAIRIVGATRVLAVLLTVFFLVTFAFSHMEQCFSLLVQYRFSLSVDQAGLSAGLVLMWAGIVSATMQGGVIRILVKYLSLERLLCIGLLLWSLAIGLFPFWSSYPWFFLGATLLALGSGCANPSIMALISKSAPSTDQGSVLGLTQGVGSLARAIGPFSGLIAFNVWYALPFLIAAAVDLSLITLVVVGLSVLKRRGATATT